MDISQIAGLLQQSSPTQVQDGPKGSLMGQAVTKADPMSLVADSAEEAGFAKSEREETRLEERKLKPLGPNVERVEQIQKYLELIDKQGKGARMDAFHAALRGAKNLDARTALALAKQHFSDPADVYAALAGAGQDLGPEELFAEAMAQLEDGEGAQVAARLAAGVRAAEFGSLGNGDDLKDLYAGAVLDAASPMEIFERIAKDFGESRLDEALDFLTKTLGDAMAATTSDTDKAQLATVSKDLEGVRLLRGLHASCKDLLQTVRSNLGITPKLDASALLKQMLQLRDTQFVGAFDIENLASDLGVDDLEQRILFYQELQKTVRSLPLNLFNDASGRLGIIDAVQTALDDAITAETELYEE